MFEELAGGDVVVGVDLVTDGEEMIWRVVPSDGAGDLDDNVDGLMDDGEVLRDNSDCTDGDQT